MRLSMPQPFPESLHTTWPWKKSNIRRLEQSSPPITVCDLIDNKGNLVGECFFIEDADLILKAVRLHNKFFPQRTAVKTKKRKIHS